MQNFFYHICFSKFMRNQAHNLGNYGENSMQVDVYACATFTSSEHDMKQAFIDAYSEEKSKEMFSKT